MIMFLIIVNYGKLWQTFGEGHRDPCQYLANTVMMITWKTFHIQLRLTTCQTLHWLHTTWEQEGIGSLKTSENNLVTQLYVKLETKFREDFTITLFSTRAFSILLVERISVPRLVLLCLFLDLGFSPHLISNSLDLLLLPIFVTFIFYVFSFCSFQVGFW